MLEKTFGPLYSKILRLLLLCSEDSTGISLGCLIFHGAERPTVLRFTHGASCRADATLARVGLTLAACRGLKFRVVRQNPPAEWEA